MNMFKVGDRVIVNGSEVHCTEYVINEPGVIVEQEPMHPVYDWRVKVGGDFLFFTEGELTPAPAKDDVPQPGDRVRVEFTRGNVNDILASESVVKGDGYYYGKSYRDNGGATVTILERATPTNFPADDIDERLEILGRKLGDALRRIERLEGTPAAEAAKGAEDEEWEYFSSNGHYWRYRAGSERGQIWVENNLAWERSGAPRQYQLVRDEIPPADLPAAARESA